MSRANYVSYDARSEYPYIMVSKRYPMSRFDLYAENLDSMDEFYALKRAGYALLFRFVAVEVRVKESCAIPYMSFDKCVECSSPKLDNGRVLSAAHIVCVLTDIDLEIILSQYKITHKAIQQVYISKLDYLPLPIRRHVLDGFAEKCGFEERGEKESLYYGKCKNRLNGNFGMLYTDPVRDDVMFNADMGADGKRWTVNRCESSKEALTKFYNNRNNFLNYQWGVWTTAHARRHHQRLLDAFGAEVVYGDTDSGKGTDCTGRVARRIARINAKIMRECDRTGAYYDSEVLGRLYMGVFVREHDMTDFKSMGAKRYAYIDAEDGSLHVTISGVQKRNKSLGITSAEELGSLDAFKEGFVFSKCGGMELKYHDLDEVKTITIRHEGVDHIVHVGSNVSVLDSTYTLGLGHDYGALIQALKKDKKFLKSR